MAKLNSGKKSVIRKIIIVVLVLIIFYEVYAIYSQEKERNIAVSEYEEIASENVQIVDDGEEETAKENTESTKEEYYPNLVIDHDALLEVNEDYIGWLYFDFDVSDDYDFTLNYPIVKEQEIDEYLHKTFENTVNSSGCVFMDKDSDKGFNGYTDFLFGHNMRNGSMFGSLDNIYKTKDTETIENEPLYVYVYTPAKVLKYVIYEYEQTTSGDPTVYNVISDEEGYDEYVEYMDSLGNYDCPIEVSFESRPEILNLSTCSGASGTNKRLVIHCVRIATIEIEE